MLCIYFELIPIKIGFKKIFEVAQKLDKRPCTVVQGLSTNFIQNGKERNLITFLMHIHVLILCI